MITTWDKIKAWFKDSLTILWARVQILFAAIWGVLTTTDLAPLLNAKWLTAWLVFSGVVTELFAAGRSNVWQAIIGFIGGPVIKGLIDAYNIHVKAQSADAATAASLAGKEIAVQQAEIQAQAQLKIAEIGHWCEPEKLFAYVTLFFYAKVLIYDKCLGWGTTDEVNGTVASWAGLVMSFYFAKRGFENVARIIKR